MQEERAPNSPQSPKTWNGYTIVPEPPKAAQQAMPAAQKPKTWNGYTIVSGPPRDETTWGEDVADVGVSLLKGAIALPGSVAGLGHMAGDYLGRTPAGRAAGAAFDATLGEGARALKRGAANVARSLGASEALGDTIEGLGIDFNRAQDIVDGWYSEGHKAKQREFAQADGVLDKTRYALANPSLIANVLAESAPSMLGAGGIARGLAAVPKLGKLSAATRAAMGEGILGAGSAAAQLRAESPGGRLSGRETAAAIGSGVGTGVFGLVGGKVAQKLGLGDIDTMLAGRALVDVKKAMTAEAADAVQKVLAQKLGSVALAKNVAGSAVSEGLLEELPQSVQEQMWQNWAQGKALMEGVSDAAVLGTLAGGVMGAGAGAARHSQQRQEQKAVRQLQESREAREAQARVDDARAEVDAAMQDVGLGTSQGGQQSNEAEEISARLAQLQIARSERGLSDEEAAEWQALSSAQTRMLEDEEGGEFEAQELARDLEDAAQADAAGQEAAPRPSEQMGLNPDNGPLSAAAALAVDSGAARVAPSGQQQTGTAQAQALEGSGQQVQAAQAGQDSGAEIIQAVQTKSGDAQEAARQRLAEIEAEARALRARLQGEQTGRPTRVQPVQANVQEDVPVQPIEASPGGLGVRLAPQGEGVTPVAAPARADYGQAWEQNGAQAQAQQPVAQAVAQTPAERWAAMPQDARRAVAQASTLNAIARGGVPTRNWEQLGPSVQEKLAAAMPQQQAETAQAMPGPAAAQAGQDSRGGQVVRSPMILRAKALIRKAIAHVRASRQHKERYALMPVSQKQVEEARRNGLDIAGYTHIIDGSAIRHAFKHHGDEKSEGSRGLVAITAADLESIPDILAAPDEVRYGMKNSKGQDVVGYLKKMPDGTTVYLESVRTGKQALAMQTLWKHPREVAAVSIRKALLQTSGTARGRMQSVAKIPRRINPRDTPQYRWNLMRPEQRQEVVQASTLAAAIKQRGEVHGKTWAQLPEGMRRNLAAAMAAQGQEAQGVQATQGGGEAAFSRSRSTQATYEARIDELYNNGSPKYPGARMLDTSDMLVLLGHGGKPVFLAESKVVQGQAKHQLTAADWKKVPQWLENPAAVFESATVPGRLVFIGPELVGGAPVRMIVAPDQGRSQIHVLVNAYDAHGGQGAFRQWARDGLLRFYDQQKAPGVIRSLQPQLASLPEIKGRARILTEEDLAHLRQVKVGPATFSPQPTSATTRVAQQAQSLTKGWPNAPEVVVVQDMQDARVPQSVRESHEGQKSRGARGQVEGFFHGGRVYLVANALHAQRDVARVLFHEALGHHGLRAAFGTEMGKVLNLVSLTRRAEVEARRKQYGLPETQEGRQMAAEEVLATMAQTQPEISLVQRAIAAIRTWLRQNVPGLDSLRMLDAEIIRSFILPARAFVQGGSSSAAAAESGAVRFAMGLGNRFAIAPEGVSKSEAEAEIDKVRSKESEPPKPLRNQETGTVAFIYSNQVGKLLSNAAVAKSEANGFTRAQHNAMVAKIGTLWESATLAAVLPDRKGTQGVSMMRFVAPVLIDGQLNYAMLSIKSTVQNGQRIYTLEAHAEKTLRGTLDKLGREEHGSVLIPARSVASIVPDQGKPVKLEAHAEKTLRGMLDKLGLEESGSVLTPARSADKILNHLHETVKRAEDGQGPVMFSLSEEVAGVVGDGVGEPSPNYLPATGKSRLGDLLDQQAYNWVDKLTDLKGVQKAISTLEGAISEDQDVYGKEETWHKRSGKRQANLLRDEVQPLMRHMRAMGISMELLEKFLHARHAPEANAAMSARNLTQAQLEARRKEARAKVTEAAQAYQDARAEKAALGQAATQEHSEQVRELRKEWLAAKKEAQAWSQARAFQGTEEERLSLSGMSDAQARAFMESLTTEQRQKLEVLAARVDAIQAKTLQEMEGYGLESRETLDAWRKQYKYYIPLHRDEAHPEGNSSHPTGQGFSTRGAAARGRVGSNQKVTNILAHIVMQREAAITRGEKNRVATSLYRLASQHPDAQLWKLDTVPKTRRVDEATGTVRSMPDPLALQGDNVIAVRIGGRDRLIVFNERNEKAMRMSRALKNLDAAQLDRFTRAGARMTRYFSAINTQYNPVFSFTNFARDFSSTLIQMSDTPIAGRQVEFIKNLKHIFAIYGNLRRQRKSGPASEGAGDNDTARLYEQFELDGGTTGFRDLYHDPQERAEALQKALAEIGGEGNALQRLHRVSTRPLLDWLSDWNETFEGAVRFAVYKTALDAGQSRHSAAKIAKNISVNFNRKGALTPYWAAWIPFFNAAMQGSARMVQTLSQPHALAKAMTGGMALGMAMEMVGRAVMGGSGGQEDDDGWSKIPDFVKEKNLIIPLDGKRYITVPMPLGWHVFPMMGQKAAAFAWHNDPTQKRHKHVTDLLLGVADAFNPLGETNNPLNMFTPAPIKPVAALATNSDWRGREIYRADLSSLNPKPGHSRARDSASDFSHGVSRMLNAMTGGNEWRAGAWSFSPDAIDYAIGELTGGVGREAMKLQGTIRALHSGEEIPTHRRFLASRFYGSTDGASGQQESFYRNLREISNQRNEAKGRIAAGQGGFAALAAAPLAPLYQRSQNAHRRIQKLREQRNALQKQSGVADRVQKIRALNAKIEQEMRAINRAVRQRVEAAQGAGLVAARG